MTAEVPMKIHLHHPGLRSVDYMVSMDSMDSKDIHGYPWISMGVHGYPWIFADIHGYHVYQWISMDIHGCLRTFMYLYPKSALLE